MWQIVAAVVFLLILIKMTGLYGSNSVRIIFTVETGYDFHITLNGLGAGKNVDIKPDKIIFCL